MNPVFSHTLFQSLTPITRHTVNTGTYRLNSSAVISVTNADVIV